jgi:hypothetical protein
MPLIPCPKCSAQLRVPDGASGAARCPQCKTVIPLSKPKPAFEVIEDAPPPPPPKPRPTPKPTPPVVETRTKPKPPLPPPAPPEKKKLASTADFEIIEPEPRRAAKTESEEELPKRTRRERPIDLDDDEDDRQRRRRPRDLDEDDRPRGRRRPERVDDDDDRPRRRRPMDLDDDYEDERRRRSSRDLEDDFEDDRPRRRGRGRDRYDDDFERRGNPKAGFGRAKIGVLLIQISLWLYLSVFAICALLVLLAWARAIGSGIAILPGLVGLGNWIVGLIGLSFCIAGPSKSRGMAIAATAVAAVHLLLILLGFGASQSNNPRNILMAMGGSDIYWLIFSSLLPLLNFVLPALTFLADGAGAPAARGSSDSLRQAIFPLLIAVSELARLILMLLTLKALARACKDDDAGVRAQLGLKGVLLAVVGLLVITLILSVILKNVNLGRGTEAIAMLSVTLMFAIYAAMLFLPALSAMMLQSTLARKAR